MPSQPSPSTSVQAARQALADLLKELRTDAELSAQELSAAAGWHKSKTSRIERAVQPVTVDDIRTWCRVCEAPGEMVDDLVASMRAAEGAYTEWKRLQRPGQRRFQESHIPLYERTRRFRSYQSQVVPGLLQTTSYAQALLALFAAQTEVPDESTDAAVARVARQQVLYTDRRFAFVLEESVLRYGLGGPAAMVEQLRRLLEVMSLPSVSLGVIPTSVTHRPMWTLEGFLLFDDSLAHVELLTARVALTAPGELSGYVKAFQTLSGFAVYGDRARELIRSALDSFSG